MVQVLPLCRPQQCQDWIRLQDVRFTAVVDFCRLDGTPVGAFLAQLQGQNALLNDIVIDEDGHPLISQLCNSSPGKLYLLGDSSRSTGQA